jgi:hypothetical protein
MINYLDEELFKFKRFKQSTTVVRGETASFHTQNATNKTIAHIERESETTYLIDPDSKDNEYYKNEDNQKEFIKKAKASYLERTKQTMQKSQEKALIKETVINIKKDTKLKDIHKLFKNLNKEFGGHKVFNIAIHRDEGYFYNPKEDLEYRPNRDIHYNKDKKAFYLDKDFKKLANMKNFEKRHNFHAHIVYSTFDLDKGKGSMNREDMRKVQTITAESLKMKRGEKGSKAERVSHWELKAREDIKREVKKEIQTQFKEKEKALKKQIALMRHKLKTNGASRNDYALLEEKTKALEQKLKEEKKEKLEEKRTKEKAQEEVKQVAQRNLKLHEQLHEYKKLEDEKTKEVKKPKGKEMSR